ncbi:ArnT family glycosyltransferase, partial [Singulisphaera rosea]
MPASTPRADIPKAWTALVVVILLGVHYALAFDSLRRENPTVDEIAHLPAGVSYWETGTFKLYPHNPPLAKLVAALPVLLARPVTEPLYHLGSWTNNPPSQASFGQSFAFLNAGRYFELFTRARAVMPLFSIVAGLSLFAWSTRLYGRSGGLL